MFQKREFSVLMTIVVVTAIHLSCLTIYWVGWSWAAVITAIVMYQIRGFGITGVYHRYFSHKSYKTSRWFQFLLALWGCSALQGTPIEWSRNHRHHHRYSDQPEDLHSPRQRGFWWAHIGWMLSMKNEVPEQSVKDIEKYPELRATAYLQIIPILAVPLFCYWLGEALGPEYHTSGWQMLVWGFCVSTVILWHVTYSINSLTHIWGKQRFKTGDDSKNSFLLGLLALGEGWHNNHHRYPGSCRQGFYWWEIDTTYYVLKLFEKLGLVWDVRKPPERIYSEAEHGSKQAA
ncbi:MAG: acyl-CoA desaturase [Candidatus Dadabacteria bacterium]|nr:MAG: acyl-CoA desaturase [Candidatus Dadabacteria bacterium]